MDHLRRNLAALLLSLCLALPAKAQEPPPPGPTPPPGQQPVDSPSVPPNPPQTLPEPTGTPAPVPPGAPTPTVPGGGPDRIEFQLKFPPEKGGGSAAGSAASLDYQRDDYAVLAGDVHIKYQDMELQAQTAEIDLDTKVVTAKGSVIIDQGPRRLTGDTAVFDLNTKTGKLTNATGHVAPDYYFTGTEVAKTGDDSYTITDGIFTSCSQKTPDWSFRLSSARVEMEEYAHVRNATIRAKKLPIFYTPYILWPVKSERTSGFLVPNFGYSDRRGASLGLAYYQTLGQSYDTTFHLDTYTQNYLGIGNELRYRPTQGTRGDFLGYVIHDPLEDKWRWKVEWNQETRDLPKGMRAVIAYQDFSDFNFFQDFERDFDRNTRRFIDSRAFLSGNWGPHLFTALLNDHQTFIGDGEDILDQRRLPEVDYSLRSTRIGHSPFYMQFVGSASYLQTEQPDSYSGKYGRLDAFPQVSLPVRSFPWLSLTVTGGGRVTYYQDSLSDAPNPNARRFTGDSLTRVLPSGTAEIVGPSFSRIFDWKLGAFGRFKHVIEPRWTYVYLGDFDQPNEVPRFDEVDNLRSTNAGRFVFANRFLGKPKSGQESAREVIYFEIARRYSFDSTQPLQSGNLNGEPLTSQAGPLESLLRFNPGDRTSVKLEADYDTLFSGLSSTALSGNVGLRRNDVLGLTWFTRFQPATGKTAANQLRLTGGFDILPTKLRLDGQINYDAQTKLLQQQIYTLNWNSQCFGVRLEWRDFRAGEGSRVRDKDFRFALSLKNVGTFLDLTSRSSTRQEP